MYKKILLAFTLFFGVNLSAESYDKFKINLGGMLVTDFSTEAKYNRNAGLILPEIDFKKDLDFEEESSVFRLDGYYRFNLRHSIDFAYYGVKSNGYKLLEKDIQWNDKIINVGANVYSHFNMDVYKISYGYSFYHDEDLELMFSAGLHITDIDMGIQVVGKNNERPSDSSGTTEGVAIPLPVIGFRGEYALIDKTLFTTFKAEFLYLEYDEYIGSVVSANLGVEYRFLKSYGLGVGYSTNIIKFEQKNDKKQVNIKNGLSGVMVYLTYIY